MEDGNGVEVSGVTFLRAKLGKLVVKIKSKLNGQLICG